MVKNRIATFLVTPVGISELIQLMSEQLSTGASVLGTNACVSVSVSVCLCDKIARLFLQSVQKCFQCS